MEEQFTPGEWKINHWSHGKSGVSCVGDIDGITYFTGDAVESSFYGIRSKIDPMKHNIMGSFEGAHIADFEDHAYLPIRNAETLANVRLMAASKDLYAALKAFYDKFGDIDNALNKQAKTALLKAKGK